LVEEKTEKYCFGGVDSGKGDKYASVQVWNKVNGESMLLKNSESVYILTMTVDSICIFNREQFVI
jgi:hypothetical protein